MGALAQWQRRRVQELFSTELSGDLSVTRLATECALSNSHFAETIKTSFGTSVHRMVVALRIMKAKNLLLDLDMPLAEVALQVGFADQTSFTRAFKAAIGDPPGRWRRGIRR